MIALSSVRPLAESSLEAFENQQRALESWLPIFDRIIFFNAPELYHYPKQVQHVACEGKPFIKDMVEKACLQKDWTCLINADIICGPRFMLAFTKLKMTLARAAISLRYQFKQGEAIECAKVTDLGLDFFVATPDTWKAIYALVPARFQLGKILWDSWMLSNLTLVTGGNIADLTPARVIFHPFHEGRNDQSMNTEGMSDHDLRHLRPLHWPKIVIH